LSGGTDENNEEPQLSFREMGCENVDWIQLAQIGAVAGSFENGNDPSGSTKFVEFCTY
jgi:hypothetical protein